MSLVPGSPHQRRDRRIASTLRAAVADLRVGGRIELARSIERCANELDPYPIEVPACRQLAIVA